MEDTFKSNLTKFEQQLQDIKQQREKVLQEIYKLDPKQERLDLFEKFKLHIKEFNKNLKCVDHEEEERRKMIEGKIDINIYFMFK